jgi:hypothetical protein
VPEVFHKLEVSIEPEVESVISMRVINRAAWPLMIIRFDSNRRVGEEFEGVRGIFLQIKLLE